MVQKAQSTHAPQAPMPEFIRPKEAAQLLMCAESTVWRWAKEFPDFPRPRRLGYRCTLFSRAELLEYINSKVTEAA